jgi:hypothetical protein
MLVGIAILAVVLYYLYKWLTGSEESQDMVIYSNQGDGLVAIKENIFEKKYIPTIYGGGEYSISTWIYVNNWAANSGKNKVFLTLLSGSLGAGMIATVVMYLGQRQNKLGIRISHEGSEATATITGEQLRAITDGVPPYTDVATDFKKCDIEQVDLQKWVNINLVMSGRTADVYIDGKLSRSCVLPGMFKVADPNSTMLMLGTPSGFGGYIGTTQAANFAYSPDQVYRIYQNGPVDNSFWAQLKRWFDPRQYSFSLKRDGKEIVSADSATGKVSTSLFDTKTSGSTATAAPTAPTAAGMAPA